MRKTGSESWTCPSSHRDEGLVLEFQTQHYVPGAPLASRDMRTCPGSSQHGRARCQLMWSPLPIPLCRTVSSVTPIVQSNHPFGSFPLLLSGTFVTHHLSNWITSASAQRICVCDLHIPWDPTKCHQLMCVYDQLVKQTQWWSHWWMEVTLYFLKDREVCGSQ